MILAHFYESGEDTLRLTVSGHAGYGDGGADIVCAAVSGIFYALAGYLANSEFKANIRAARSGFADIECSRGGEEAMKQACIGLLQIQLSYPGTVNVSNSLWSWKLGKPG